MSEHGSLGLVLNRGLVCHTTYHCYSLLKGLPAQSQLTQLNMLPTKQELENRKWIINDDHTHCLFSLSLLLHTIDDIYYQSCKRQQIIIGPCIIQFKALVYLSGSPVEILSKKLGQCWANVCDISPHVPKHCPAPCVFISHWGTVRSDVCVLSVIILPFLWITMGQNCNMCYCIIKCEHNATLMTLCCHLFKNISKNTTELKSHKFIILTHLNILEPTRE